MCSLVRNVCLCVCMWVYCNTAIGFGANLNINTKNQLKPTSLFTGNICQVLVNTPFILPRSLSHAIQILQDFTHQAWIHLWKLQDRNVHQNRDPVGPNKKPLEWNIFILMWVVRYETCMSLNLNVNKDILFLFFFLIKKPFVMPIPDNSKALRTAYVQKTINNGWYPTVKNMINCTFFFCGCWCRYQGDNLSYSKFVQKNKLQ